MSLAVRDFPAFFKVVHGHEPFAWQVELAERVCSAGWPAALDVPTGLGKTAVLDVAVFALALQAELAPADRTARTRTFLVVDRRVIVDQAYVRARRLVEALEGGDGILTEVYRRLALLAGRGSPALTATRMRGGVTWASRWLSSAAQPALVTGTVDQLGSRLLFRGYGTSQAMRPVDAALCGTDSLLLLDEAHLSQPFLRTVRAVAGYEAAADSPVLAHRPLRAVLLSATLPRPSDGSLDDVLRCDPDGETSTAARARLGAVKSTALLDVNAKGELAPVLKAFALDASERGAERVGVVCNTVALARAVFDLLPTDGPDRALLIGRCREAERERNAEVWLHDRLAAVPDRQPARPVVVVATQTVEVGADIDFDALITEACPLDALTQRLGRLNRLGRTPSAEAVVVHDASLHGAEAAVYGSATARTWDWLVAEAGAPVLPVAPSKALAAVAAAGRLDLGAGGVLRTVEPAVRAGLVSESPPAPVALSPVLDLWARTHPAPDPDQPVGPFLHGLAQPRAEVSFCWRAGLASPEAWEEELELCPPAAHETVLVSYAEARRVLGLSRSVSLLADAEGAVGWEDLVEDFEEAPGLVGWVVGPDQSRVALGGRTRLRPGSTVVLDSGAGGHDAWGWTGKLDGVPVQDVADLGGPGPYRLRLRPGVWPVADVPDGASLDLGSDDRDSELADLLHRLEELADPVTPAGRHLQKVLALARHPKARVRWTHTGAVLTVPRNGVISEPTDGDDADAASSSRCALHVGLERHLRDVEQAAGAEAHALGLAPALVRSIALAGLAHDLGKADERFQLLLHGGNPYRLELANEPVAKSRTEALSWAERRRIQRASGWPHRMRHEAISAALVAELARQHPQVFADTDVELVLHLVGTHHGRGRPLLPAVADATPVSVTATLPASSNGKAVTATVTSDVGIVDWEQPERFARLTGAYGRWGLALLETLLRLSDMAVSEGYERDDRSA